MICKCYMFAYESHNFLNLLELAKLFDLHFLWASIHKCLLFHLFYNPYYTHYKNDIFTISHQGSEIRALGS